MKIFITGGAGFIGCNSANYFLKNGHRIILFDNLSRLGGRANVEWLHQQYGQQLRLIEGDIRDYDHLVEVIGDAQVVLHLASQVAVTSSIVDPREDFEINALGTFNVLEAVRHSCPEAAVLYASTNKVYGGMERIEIVDQGDRYAYAVFDQGVPETFDLDFHSPYGCSKGAGDQYMLDYARIYGLKTIVFRQSCIYGPRQFGVEDQGWVAHFIIASILNRPISIYGDGKQVRDLLHVDDLIRAYETGIMAINELSGQVFNMGGGPANSLSIWTEFGPMLEALAKRPLAVTHTSWRPGDQRVFISDIRKAMDKLDWKPTISPVQGIRELYEWVSANKGLF